MILHKKEGGDLGYSSVTEYVLSILEASVQNPALRRIKREGDQEEGNKTKSEPPQLT